MTLILTVTKTQNLTKAIKTTQRPQSRRRSSSIIITMMEVYQLLLLSTLLFCAVSARDLKLILEDDFNTFNVSLWRHQITAGGGGNWEFELYDNNRTTSFVRDGALNIKPALMVDDIGEANLKGGYNLDIWGGTPADLCTAPSFYGCFRTAGAGGNWINPVKSASVRTAESFSFKYGKVEVRAKLPRGDWLWPAIWMLPKWNAYGKWPSSGEIDIMESRGNSPKYPPGGYDTFGSTLHFGPGWTDDPYQLTHATYKAPMDPTADYHVYGMVWNETYIGTYFDKEENVVLSVPITEPFFTKGGWGPHWNNPWQDGPKNAPFDQEFYLIINLAVGGTNGYFPEGNGKPWSNTDPHAVNSFWSAKDQWYPTWTQPMMVDSVKVWSYTD
ncbi:beta-1,3-glucan-binding protein-like [Halichondria panicea]|uniref:beta-1,3-glucan-binding protein-like n=1 Tax=Halichondria panicea TaxID=6063 RepID=UPI00312B612B